MQAIVVEQKEAAVAAIEVAQPVVIGCKLDVWKGRAMQTILVRQKVVEISSKNSVIIHIGQLVMDC
jgi:hypothetical protein